MNANTPSLLNACAIPSWNGGLPFRHPWRIPTQRLLAIARLPTQPHDAIARNPTAGREINASLSPARFPPLSAARLDEAALIQSP